MRYPTAMYLCGKPRLAIIVLAVLFGLTFSSQGLLGAKMAGPHPDMAMTMPGMSSADEPADCPSHDGVSQANCVAACAGFTGLVLEPVIFVFVGAPHAPMNERVASLSDRSIPPEPHPPRPSALI